MNTTGQIRDEARKDPEVLQREIDEARADVGETLDALQARLSPGQLLDEALGYFKGHSSEMARNIGYRIRENPTPVLIAAGIGLAWLIASRRSSSSSVDESWYETGAEDYGEASGPGLRERLRARASSVGSRLSEARQHMRERVSQGTGSLSESMGSVREGARHQAEYARERALRARQSASRLMEEQPLVLGLVGVGVGALLGAVLPTTRKEDELLGTMRDRALERAKQLGAEQYDRARDTLRQAAEGAKQAVSQQTQSGGQSSQQQQATTGEGSPQPAL